MLVVSQIQIDFILLNIKGSDRILFLPFPFLWAWSETGSGTCLYLSDQFESDTRCESD